MIVGYHSFSYYRRYMKHEGLSNSKFYTVVTKKIARFNRRLPLSAVIESMQRADQQLNVSSTGDK